MSHAAPFSSPVRAVLFDLDDTLCDDLAAAERAIRATAVRAAEHLPGLFTNALTDAYIRLSDIHWNAIDLVAPPPLAEIRALLWRNALNECGHGTCDTALVDDVVALHAELRRGGVHLFVDALSTLDTLRARGLRLALVTNGVSETHAEKVVALGILDHFDTLLMPDQVGFAKPDVRVFHTACARLGVPPGEAVMVGDSLWADIAGAKQAGLRAVWYNPQHTALPPGAIAPDAEVRSLAEVVDLLLGSA